LAKAAAFFDLDHTLIRRASVLALAGTFRERGVVSRVDMAKAGLWQLLFTMRGADDETLRRAAEAGMRFLKGYSVDDMRELVGGAMETVLRPLVYEEPIQLVEQHRARGDCVYIVSASLQEIVDLIAADLKFDGAVGSTGEIIDGVYTGRAIRGAHGKAKAVAVREIAEAHDIDLSISTAYSDSHTDCPLFEAVGHPIAVNPDRKLRRIARRRGWPILEFTRHAA
jgi:HAD superfamily hydrolase (TIGR01490 family)